MKWVEKVRQKPQHVRERMLLVLLAVIVPIIFVVWLATFGSETGGPTGSLKKDFAPFVQFGSFVSKSAKGVFGGAKTATPDATATTPTATMDATPAVSASTQ